MHLSSCAYRTTGSISFQNPTPDTKPKVTEHLETGLGSLSIDGGSPPKVSVSAALGFVRSPSPSSEVTPPQSLQEVVSTSHEEVQASDLVSTLNDYAIKLIEDIMNNNWKDSVSLSEKDMRLATSGLIKLLNVFKASEKVENGHAKAFCDYLGLLMKYPFRREREDIDLYIHAAKSSIQMELCVNGASYRWHCTRYAHKLVLDNIAYMLPYQY